MTGILGLSDFFADGQDVSLMDGVERVLRKKSRKRPLDWCVTTPRGEGGGGDGKSKANRSAKRIARSSKSRRSKSTPRQPKTKRRVGVLNVAALLNKHISPEEIRRLREIAIKIAHFPKSHALQETHHRTCHCCGNVRKQCVMS